MTTKKKLNKANLFLWLLAIVYSIVMAFSYFVNDFSLMIYSGFVIIILIMVANSDMERLYKK